MKLHKNKEAFKGLILQIKELTKLSEDILEKDYYVTLLLKELTDKQEEVKAYFKGGTALYKAIGGIKRFSEDIDLTVDVTGLSSNQARKRLEAAAYNYSLSLNKEDEHSSERKGSINAIYDYESVFFTDVKEELQRFGKVLIEATSFTVSEPITKYTIAPLIYDFSIEKTKTILREQFDVAPFEIQTIEIARIFIDKMFATEFYFKRQNFKDVAKHIYDLVVLSNIDTIKKLLENKEQLHYLISLKRREELLRKGGIPADQKIEDFTYFIGLENNIDFNMAFEKMQNKYVFSKTDAIEITEVLNTVKALRNKFLKALV